MATLDVINQDSKKVGTVEVSDAVFAAEVNVPLVHQAIKTQLAARRRGTACTKTKGEVQGSGKKPFRQKGTGNARQGDVRSPLQVGGGTMHGPRPRSFAIKMNKEMARGALRSALSDRLASKRLMVVDEFKLESPKTKVFDSILKKGLKLENALIVDENNQNLELSGRNLPHVRVLRTEGINVYDIVRHDWLVLSKKAIESLNQRLATQAKAKES